MEDILTVSIFFFVIAIIYSSVGFGGGSSYLALLVLAGVDIFTLRSTALLCNIIVVTSGTYIFYQKGYLNIRDNWPIIAASVPMAFLGGYWPLSSQLIFILLGTALTGAAALMFIKVHHRHAPRSSHPPLSAAAIGGTIGLLSGMVGIGGGIFLAPLLNLIGWSRPKRIAAIASFFILVNSIAGLLGQWAQRPPEVDGLIVWPLLVAVFMGGQIGSRLSSEKFSNRTIQRTTAVLILFAGLKVLNDHLIEDLFFNGG